MAPYRSPLPAPRRSSSTASWCPTARAGCVIDPSSLRPLSRRVGRTSTLLQALENFRYKDLRLTIDGRTDGEMDVGLHIAGANPDLYDGYPIEFNLNLEGALANVLRQGLAGYQIPERIREQMQGFGR